MQSVKKIRAAIESEFEVVGGIIQSPGKFECEAVWVPYFWSLVMECEGQDIYDEDGELEATRFQVDAEEEEAFADALGGELKCGSTVELFQDSQGFVIGRVLD